MAQYKLTYFNLRGRAEIIRLVFAAAGVEYEDVRVEREQWPALKPDVPFGQIPIIEFDGKKFCQSHSIARYLANKFGLAGKTDIEKLRADMLVDCIADVFQGVSNIRREQDSAKKDEMKKKYVEEQLPGYMNNLEKLLVENKGGDGYLVGDDLTWADLAFIALIDVLTFVGEQAVQKVTSHAKLQALRDRVQKLPKIAAWLAKRPKTDI